MASVHFVFSRIWTEYREIRSISLYTLQMREMWTRKTPKIDIFHAVFPKIVHSFQQLIWRSGSAIVMECMYILLMFTHVSVTHYI